MSKKAKEIIELHLGSDYWKFEESEYFENLVNAVDEALSITPVVGRSEQLKARLTDEEQEKLKDELRERGSLLSRINKKNRKEFLNDTSKLWLTY